MCPEILARAAAVRAQRAKSPLVGDADVVEGRVRAVMDAHPDWQFDDLVVADGGLYLTSDDMSEPADQAFWATLISAGPRVAVVATEVARRLKLPLRDGFPPGAGHQVRFEPKLS